MKNTLLKLLRIIAIVLMGLTAAFTLMGGAGTTCVALAAEKFGEKMAPLAPYQWLYVLFVLVTLAIGVLGVRAVVLLIKRRPHAYRDSLIVLLAGVMVGAIHMAVSRSLRGSSMPVDMVVYTTVLTLIIFLILRIPAIWQGINLEKSGTGNDERPGAAAITLLLCGTLTLTIQHWGGPTHTFSGINYADAWHTQLAVIGWGLVLFGAILTVKAITGVSLVVFRRGEKITHPSNTS
jgi:hypothetical protein